MSAELNYIQLEGESIEPDVASFINYPSYGNFFLPLACNIQPMPQPDAGISAATGWDVSTVLTYDELVQAAADSPAANNTGHIELYYYNNSEASHNITIIEVNITNDTKKRIYSFVAV